jgi:hypothetical protein
MRGKFVAVSALGLLVMSGTSHAAAYPWTGSAMIVGTISQPTYVSVAPVLVDPGWAGTPSAYFTTSHQIVSKYSNGNVFDTSVVEVEVDDFASGIYDPTGQTRYPGHFALISGASVKISDDARLVTYGGFGFTHGFASFSGVDYHYEISLPDGLSVAGEDPIAPAVPEPSTWAMLLLGFAGIGFATYRKKFRQFR